jgi:hypothetical protein
MPFLSSILAKITGEAIKSGAETVKTATEIPKNLIETKKAHLEVAELVHARGSRESRIVPATMDDINKFDPKHRRLIQKVLASETDEPTNTIALRVRTRSILPSIILWVLVLLGGIYGYWHKQIGQSVELLFKERRRTFTNTNPR